MQEFSFLKYDLLEYILNKNKIYLKIFSIFLYKKNEFNKKNKYILQIKQIMF